MEYPDGCSTAIRHVVRKVAVMEGGLVYFTPWGCNFQMGGLAYDTFPFHFSQFLSNSLNYLFSNFPSS